MPRRSIDALAPLAEPVRRALYELVVARPEPVDRETAANALGIAKPLAAFHLDRLVRDGLLAADYRRRTGRRGPGAGRPAKFYRRAPHVEIEVTLPPRRYDVAADILAAGVDVSEAAADRAREEARRVGIEMARAHQDPSPDAGLLEVLRESGYEPEVQGQTIRLRNCPFDAIVKRHRELTCSINLCLLESVAHEVLGPAATATVAPAPGYCCVVIERSDPTAA